MSRVLVIASMLFAACGGDGPFTIVTLEARPAVHDVAEVLVELTNEGTTLDQRFTVDNLTFPATFSIESPGRTGPIDLVIQAFDREGLVVGRGAGQVTIASPGASVLIDSTDFVVNTTFPEDQFPADDFDSHGFQISATDDGTFTVVFRERCFQPEGCHMLARRFDVTGRPVETALAAGTNAFNLSSDVTTSGATPSVASIGDTTVTAWDFSEPSPSTTDGVACRAMDREGNAVGDQVPISIEAFPNVVSVSPVAVGTYVISWEGSGALIKGAIVDSECNINVNGVQQISVTAGAITGAVAANGNAIMYVWIVDGAVRGRIANSAGGLITGDIQIIAKPATESIQYVRIAAAGDGFLLVARLVEDASNTGPARIEAYRANNMGQLMGVPQVVSERTGNSFLSSQSFGMAARRGEGSIMVVWHSCDEFGDDNLCGVFGRVLRSDGTPDGEEFSLATTTLGNQSNPAVTALPGGAWAATWMDESQQDPDRSGTAVRARVVYPQAGTSSN